MRAFRRGEDERSSNLDKSRVMTSSCAASTDAWGAPHQEMRRTDNTEGAAGLRVRIGRFDRSHVHEPRPDRQARQINAVVHVELFHQAGPVFVDCLVAAAELGRHLLRGVPLAVMHEGRLEQVGTRRGILAKPASEFVRSLFAKPKAQLELLAEQ